MNINFNRHRVQLRCETILNCNTLEEWNNSDFRNLELTSSQASLLSGDLKDDSIDIYYKGLLSLFMAIRSVDAGLYSWATINAYYSVYYFLRSTMALNGIALVRQKSLYYLRSITGEKPVTKGNKKYNSDHSGTINYFIDLFSSDILLSQAIDSNNVYDWLMSKREQVNYRERTFNEPGHSSFWESISEKVKSNKLSEAITSYINDSYILCFQEEHAILAAPIKRAILTRNRLSDEGITPLFNSDQEKILSSILPTQIKDLEILF